MTNVPRKLLFTNRQVINLRKAFDGKSSTDLSYQNLKHIR